MDATFAVELTIKTLKNETKNCISCFGRENCREKLLKL